MLRKGVLVRRVDDNALRHIHARVLMDCYPPEGSVCVVVTSPKEKDLSHQGVYRSELSRAGVGVVGLKKAVDVMSENRLYKDCEVTAFVKIK